MNSQPAQDADLDIGALVEIASRGRRLSDKILLAFHQACDVREIEVAEQLLATAEKLLSKSHNIIRQNRRREMESLVGAHFRLWELKHGSGRAAMR